MDVPNNMPVPGYVIYRDTVPGEPYDPTTPPVFFPSKDSDELFDALRAKFPHVKTHSERMRDAIIEFLIEERQSELLQISPVAQSTSNTAATSPWQSQSWPSVSSSTLSSPDTFNLTTPTFGNSPRLPPHLPQMTRKHSTVASSVSGVESTPPALENMTGVFSLSSSEQPKQRIRRKMTEAEKVEYRKRRIVKACDKCSKRKRKCSHNQPQMETPVSTSNKVTKMATNKKPALEVPMVQFHKQESLDTVDGFDLSLPWSGEMQHFDEFTAMLEAPLNDTSTCDVLHRDWEPAQEWSWDEDSDFTLLDSVSSIGDQGTQAHTNSAQQDHLFNDVNFIAPGVNLMFANCSYSTIQSTKDKTQPIDTTLAYSDQESSNGNGKPIGNGLLWEHLRTGQEKPQPTHTAHTHQFTASDAYRNDSAGGSSGGAVASPQLSSATLPQLTLRLIGTTKAIRAFGRSLREQSASRTRISTMSLEKLTSAAASPQAQLRLAIGPSAKAEHISIFSDNNHNTQIKANAASQRLETVQIHQYMHKTPNPSYTDLNLGITSRMPSLSRKAPYVEGQRQSLRGLPSGMTINPTLSSNGTILADAETATLQVRSSGNSLGGGSLDGVSSPSLELCKLRRRIPTALQGALASVNTERPPTPLLLPEDTPQLERITFTSSSVYDGREEGTSERCNSVKHQRIVTDNYTKPVLAGLGGAHDTAHGPVHTRPRNPTAWEFGGNVDQRHICEQQSVAVPCKLLSHISPAMYAAFYERSQISTCSLSGKDRLEKKPEYRLCDHVRRRDHFGRKSSHAKAGNATQAEAAASGNYALTALSVLCMAVAAIVAAALRAHSPPLLFLLATAPLLLPALHKSVGGQIKRVNKYLLWRNRPTRILYHVAATLASSSFAGESTRQPSGRWRLSSQSYALSS